MIALALSFSLAVFAQEPVPSTTISNTEKVLTEELARAQDFYATQTTAPYYISLSVEDRHEFRIRAWADAVDRSDENHSRYVDLDLRVGSPELDNTHENYRHMPSGTAGRSVPLMGSNGDYALRHGIWLLLEKAYKDANEAYDLVRSRQTTRVESEVQAPDFELRTPNIGRFDIPELTLDTEAWESRLIAASQILAAEPVVTNSSASIRAERIVTTFVDTEGSRLRHGRIAIRVSLMAETVAEDGEELIVHRSKDVHDIEHLQAVDLVEWAEDSLEELKMLREAPRVEPYSGPVILSGKAAGVFIHEVLGHRSEGHRQKLDSEGRTFADQVGEPILPDFVDIVDDPTVAHLGGEDLNGTYLFDSQGVPAQPAPLVEDGRLVGFLMSRSPIPDFNESNGHGRKSTGRHATGRMANTILQTDESVSEAQLRKMLLAQVRDQGLEFGIIVDEIDGGFTYTSSFQPNSFSILTRTARRVYLDGRPDELVRGIDMVGTPLVAFSELMAASDELHVFNGRCGAESGWVPVSAVSPSLLFRHLEFQRKGKSTQPPPRLNKPDPQTTAPNSAPQLTELNRNLDLLNLDEAPPIYFARTQLYSGYSIHAESRFGGVMRSVERPFQRLGVELRIGSPEFDNTQGYRRAGFSSTTLPTQQTDWTTQLAAWLETDEAYLDAVEAYAERSARAEREDIGPPVYTLSEPVQLILDEPSYSLPTHLEPLSVQLTEPFVHERPFSFAVAHATAGQGYLWTHDSEGSAIRQPASRGLVRVIAGLHSDDGMLMADQRLWLSPDPSAIPSSETMLSEVIQMRDDLLNLAEAPILDQAYIGPVIFEGDAATDLFRFLLLPMLEGTPTQDPNQANDKARSGMIELQPMTGRRLLPEGWNVVDDPQGQPNQPGYAQIDQEGTPTQSIQLVEDGIVRDLFMSRIPREDLAHSNGHARGRMTSLLSGRSFQLQIDAKRQINDRQLLRRALRESRKYGLDHVVIVRRLQSPPARRVHMDASLPLPLGVYKRYSDGREELYRGASFVSISPFLLREIQAAGPQNERGYLASWSAGSLRSSDYTGLDSWISAPSVLIGEIELNPIPGDPDKVRLLPPPPVSQAAPTE